MDLDRALGRAWRDDTPWDLLTQLTEIENRLGGHPGEHRAATIVADALDQAGVRDITEQSFEMQRWTRGSTTLSLRVPDRDIERSFEAVSLPYSPAVEARGDLVDVGYGTPAEIEATNIADNIAIASTATPPDFDRFYHRIEKVAAATKAGAAGFVFTNHIPGQLPPTGALVFDHEAPLPGVGVSHETGEWLRQYADNSSGGGSNDSKRNRTSTDTTTAHLRVDTETEQGTSCNVVGVFGPAADEEILLVAHHDAHDVAEGALDNGCGVAVLLGAVRILTNLESELGTRIRVASVGSEELGLLGSRKLAASLDTDRIRAVVNIDGAGRHRQLKAMTHTSETLEGLTERVCNRVDHPVRIEDRPHPWSDHWHFLRQGVPSLQLHSDRPDAAGQWERGWTHTRADTRDKADSRTIREHAMLTALIVRELTDESVPRVDPATVRAHLEKAGTKPGMEAAGIWPETDDR